MKTVRTRMLCDGKTHVGNKTVDVDDKERDTGLSGGEHVREAEEVVLRQLGCNHEREAIEECRA